MPASVVVDASVLVSAFLFPGSVPGRILNLARRGAFTMHLSPLLIDESRYALLSTRLRARYGHDEESVTTWCADVRQVGRVFDGQPPDIELACRDQNDDHVLATAVAVNAGTIVTGDKDLLALGEFRNVRIVTARAFLTELVPDD